MAKKVLVVDDDPDIIRILEKRIKNKGYDVITAVDGQAAFEKVKDESPDLIVLDVIIPKINGSTLCGMLKADDKYKSIPIILLTVKKAEIDLEVGKLVKADAYITKPFDAEDLLKKIEELLS